MGFIIKIPKKEEIVTTTINEIILNDDAISFAVFGGKSNNEFGIGGTSYGLIKPNGLIDAGSVRFTFDIIDCSLIEVNFNTIDININVKITATNRASSPRTLISPTLLVNKGSFGSSMTSYNSSFSPTDTTRNFGIFNGFQVGVRYPDVQLAANATKVYEANGTMQVNTLGAAPETVSQIFQDTILPTIDTVVSRSIPAGNTAKSYGILQRFIFDTESLFQSKNVDFVSGAVTDTLTYTNTNRTSSTATYNAGIVLEYDDTPNPSYIFNLGSIGILNTNLSVVPVTTSTSTTIAPFVLSNGLLDSNTLTFTITDGQPDYFIELYNFATIDGTFDNEGNFIPDVNRVDGDLLFSDNYTTQGAKSASPILVPISVGFLYLFGVDGLGNEEIIPVSYIQPTTSGGGFTLPPLITTCFSQSDVDTIGYFAGASGTGGDAVLLDFIATLNFNLNQVTGAIFASSAQDPNSVTNVISDDINKTVTLQFQNPLTLGTTYQITLTTSVSGCFPQISFLYNSQGNISLV